MSEALVFAFALLGAGALALRPLLGRARWPAERPDLRDDVARAVSSLRDLEFARAAGTIDPADEAVLRSRIVASAFSAREAPAEAAPVRTFAAAALIAAVVAVAAVAYLPSSAGDRAPGGTITGTVPQAGPTVADLEKKVLAAPDDIPTRLALADAYQNAGRPAEAAGQYREVLGRDPQNVSALNALGWLLMRSGSADGALVAAERVLALRPRDADALLLKGLVLYTQQKYADAVRTWDVYLDVGEFHWGAAMVRELYPDAKQKAGQ